MEMHLCGQSWHHTIISDLHRDILERPSDLQCAWPIGYLNSAGVLYAASLWLSNSAYLYLSVSFIQMTKSLMPGLVYATGVFMGTEQFSKANAANMALIAFGVVVCAIGEVNLVFKGVMQQLAALLFEVQQDSSCRPRSSTRPSTICMRCLIVTCLMSA